MKAEENVKSYLSNLKINFITHKHPPVYTCEEAEKYNKNIRGIHSKNLFLKSKKTKQQFYLIILPADKKLKIIEIESLLNEKLSFANESELKEILNLETGAVSPFGLINDKNHKTILLIDKAIYNSNFVSFHPNINTETLELTNESFKKFLNSLKNEKQII